MRFFSKCPSSLSFLKFQLKNVNLGFKMKALKFLGIQPWSVESKITVRKLQRGPSTLDLFLLQLTDL